MMNEGNLMFNTKALEATIALHKELLADEGAAGYEGDKEAFDNLYKEVYIIVRDELPDDADVAYVCETFYDYQLEITNGDRDVCWYL
jgi:hypothetical protein